MKHLWVIVGSVMVVCLFVLSSLVVVLQGSDRPASIMAPVRYPDLVPVDIWTTPSSPMAGDPTLISLSVKNQGVVAATVEFLNYLYVDDAPSPDFIGHCTYLAKGATTSFSYSKTLAAGTHVLRLVVDATNTINEGNREQNNVLSETIAWQVNPNAMPDPVGYWDMSTLTADGKLKNLANPSGDTDGTIFDATTSEGGVLGGSLEFDGNSCAVNITDPNNALMSDSGTVSAWIKSTGKPPVTSKLEAAIVLVENGQNVTEEDIRLFGLLGDEAEAIYSELVHGNGILNVSPTIYVQKAVSAPIKYHHLLELNNYIRLGNPDTYDYICFYAKGASQGEWEINLKNTVHGIGRPDIWYDDRANFTYGTDTEPLSKYITAVATLSFQNRAPVNDSDAHQKSKWFIHEMCHAWVGWWNYTLDGVPVEPEYDSTGYHYTATYRTDLNSANGGMAWIDNPNGTWTAVANWISGNDQNNLYNHSDFNLDEYTIGLIPASEVVPTHKLSPAPPFPYNTLWALQRGFTYTATDTAIPIKNITDTMGQWWNEMDRQCVMLRCNNSPRSVFQGEGWGLFMGTVAPNDTIAWWSGPADGSNWKTWKYGKAHLCDGAWHHIAVTWSGTTGRVYVDGALDIECEINPVVALGNIHTVIGCEDAERPYFNTWFNGSIDEVYIYNTNLTAAQVGKLSGYSDDFDDGTLGPWTGTGSYVYVSDMERQSVPYSLYVEYSVGSLTGTQRATSPAMTSVDFTAPYSISFWYNKVFAGARRTSALMYVVDDGRVCLLDQANVLYAVTASGNLVIEDYLTPFVWVKFQINVDPANSSYEVLLNDVYMGTFAFLAQSSSNQITVGSPVNPTGHIMGRCYWDDFVVCGHPS